MGVRHNERCKECKKQVFALLINIFGEVKENYNLNISNRKTAFQKTPYYSNLEDIYSSLQNFRGHKNFIKRKELPNVDYYVVDHEFIIEFDESQHFTELRKLALERYPDKIKLGFDRHKWIDLCQKFDRHDNDPKYRDEQRAWYDTLRDFSPSLLHLRPTVRLFAQDYVWCDLDPDNEKDQDMFKKFLKIKLYNYKSTIIHQNPEYVNKKLFLTDKNKRRLFQTSNGEHIQIRFNRLGNLILHKITNNFEKIPLDYSLRKIGINYFDLKDPSVPQMIKYLVTPFMEVERIFNSIRYKYLESIYLSSLNNPHEYINAKYNNAFQSLAGINVYQGSTKNRKNNDDFWKSVGFKNPQKTKINFEDEKEELGFILDYFRKMDNEELSKVYVELIAIKPGFHELYIHSDYFDTDTFPTGDDIRSEVFRQLRGVSELEHSILNNLDRFPPEINRRSYFTYASCNITEGPFVFRKGIDIVYCNEIRKIKSPKDLKKLENNFYILDYYHKQMDSLSDLKHLLKKAEPFKGFVQQKLDVT
jgi:hypothetical protein